MKKTTYRIITSAVTLPTVISAIMILSPMTASASGIASPTASASDPARQIAESWYEQLVTEGKNEATFKFDKYVCVQFRDAYRQLLLMDSPDTLFDGEALALRGSVDFEFDSDSKEYKIAFPNGYDVAEADRLTTEWAGEIMKIAGEDSTDREKMYATCDYISSIYSYAYEDYEAGIFNDFVSEYYDDKKILCGQFSTVTYLIANKLGIDCHIMESLKHAYNIVRFDNDQNYIILDLTASRYGFIDSVREARINEIKPGMYNMDGIDVSDTTYVIRTTVNEGKSARPADASEYERQREYYLTHGYPVEGAEKDKTKEDPNEAVEIYAPQGSIVMDFLNKYAPIVAFTMVGTLLLRRIIVSLKHRIRKRRRKIRLYSASSSNHSSKTNKKAAA